jgi:diguanylate cyclase (GGDEF)-like protein/PAS domain S-box-containing protein
MAKPKSKPNPSHLADRSFAISLMEHLVVPTFVLDANCRVLIWNRACERLTGVPASELIGTSDHWRAFYGSPRDCLADLIAQGRTGEVKALYAEHDEQAQARHGLYAENWCVMPQLGTRLYLAIDAGPIYDEAGHLIAVVETVRDMTVQKEAQTALRELASRDGLTGLANRRSFDEALHLEWRRAMRASHMVSLLMIDVDNFKHYNDSYGHQKGDDCLKLVAKAMAAEIQRASDLVARYGGEEFVVILPGVGIEGAQVVAERIRAAVENLKLPHAQADRQIVTTSIGVATTLAAQGSDPVELLASADAALYRAKHTGRNRVVCNVEEPARMKPLP